MTGGRADPLVVRRHLAALREAPGHLHAYSDRSADELRRSADGYLKVDLSIVERVLREELKSLDAFAGHVEKYLDALS